MEMRKGLSLRFKVFLLFAGAALAIVVPALLLIANAVEKRAYASATEALDDAAAALQQNWISRGQNLAQPAQWSGKWEYRPNMPHSNEKCDVAVARKFLEDFK